MLEQNGGGESCLTLAAQLNFQATIEFLLGSELELGEAVHIEQRNSRGMSSLSTAAEAGHVVPAQFLIQKGADLAAKDDGGAQALHHAAVNGHVQMVQLLIEGGTDMDARDVDGKTPVWLAANYKHNSLVYLLSGLGADMGIRDFKGFSLLHLAAARNNKALSRFLIENGADLESRCGGATPLIYAVQSADRDLVSLLLSHGADMNAADDRGWTPCHFAAANGNDDILETLLEYSPSLMITDCDGLLPLDLAVRNGHLSTQRIINERLPVSVAAKNESAAESVTLLVASARNGHMERMLRLLKTGLDVNASDFDGKRALTSAAESGNLMGIQALLLAGADVNLADRNGETPLWWASRYNHKRAVWELLYRGAHPDLADNDGQSPLSVAAQLGHGKVARLLLQFGSNPDASVVWGKSALMFAASAGYFDIVTLLLRHRVDINYRSVAGESALSLAVVGGHDRITDLLVEHGALPHGLIRNKNYARQLCVAAQHGRIPEILRLLKVGVSPDILSATGDETALCGAAAAGKARAVEILLENGAFVDAKNNDGVTALMQAASEGHEDTVRLFRDHGASLDMKDGQGRTALMRACYGGNSDTVTLLIDLGARREARDSEGRTSLFHAVLGDQKLIVEALLTQGVNIEAVDQHGHTPLSVAVQEGKRAVAQILLGRGAQTTTNDSIEGQAPLSLAASKGHEACVDLLIDHGVDLDHRSRNEQRTALHYAVLPGHSMVVKILIEAGAEAGLVDSHGRSALSLAKENGHEECVKLLSQAASLFRNSQRATRKNEEEALSLKNIYRYQRISGETSIRLLTLFPGLPGDILTVDVEEVDLKSKPSFEALSYEWREKTGTIPIQCGNERILLTPNCKAAMERLRLPSRPRLLWIDAICINQKDVTERNHQVALMTRIYRSATSILMWLGQSDVSVTPAVLEKTFDVLPVLARVHDLLRLTPGRGSSSRKLMPINEHPEAQKLAQDALEDKEVANCIRGLYHSKYFSRAWIFQELVLAGTRGIILRDSCQCEWPLFISAMWGYEANFGSIGKHLRNIALTADDLEKDGRLKLDILVDTMSNFDARDARDMVFATLGLATNDDTTSKNLPTADYSMTVQEVFVETSRYLIDTIGIYWTANHRRSAKSIPDLPSWVGDFTAPGSVLDSIPLQPQAEQLGQLFTGQPITTGTSLHVNGAIIDRIAFKVTITKEIDAVQVVVAVARALSARGRGMFDPYMDKFQDSSPAHPHRSYGAAVLSVIFRMDILSETEVARMNSYLAWRLSTYEEIPPQLRHAPRYLESGVASWQALSQTSPRDMDLEICRAMDLRLPFGTDLILTERGYIGLTHSGEARVGMAIGWTTTALDACLLEERSEGPDKRYYEYVDKVHLALPLRNWRSLEQFAPGAVEERLEIR